jgi:hypothetical protein
VKSVLGEFVRLRKKEKVLFVLMLLIIISIPSSFWEKIVFFLMNFLLATNHGQIPKMSTTKLVGLADGC